MMGKGLRLLAMPRDPLYPFTLWDGHNLLHPLRSLSQYAGVSRPVDPCATGQYLALLQSCSCTAMMADILRSACTDTRVSQLSTLLNLHRNLLPSQEETPTSLLKGVEDSLNGLSKAYSHLTINPSH
ncbi:hypothetical protein J4Q44_G00008250 [Coregonus suidteri]|uniref:Uncharacterized protein n=1 Tax=Coregonus suidteri TaxID=861788 RepID=A0AAN8MMZ1_9TELE